MQDAAIHRAKSSFSIPETAEALLLRKTAAQEVLAVDEAIYQRKNYGDVLGLVITVRTDNGPESIQHRLYVLIKPRDIDSWSNADLYQEGATPLVLMETMSLPSADMMRLLWPVPLDDYRQGN